MIYDLESSFLPKFKEDIIRKLYFEEIDLFEKLNGVPACDLGFEELIFQ